jgi:hypothetical protein
MQTAIARGVGFEPTSSCEHGISNPTPYQARRPPPKLEILGRQYIDIDYHLCQEQKIVRTIGSHVPADTVLKRLLNGDPWLY